MFGLFNAYSYLYSYLITMIFFRREFKLTWAKHGVNYITFFWLGGFRFLKLFNDK